MGAERLKMTPEELAVEVTKRLADDIDIHTRVVRTEIYLEQLVGNGQDGTCAKRGKAIAFLQKTVFMIMGGGGVLVLLLKLGVIAI